MSRSRGVRSSEGPGRASWFSGTAPTSKSYSARSTGSCRIAPRGPAWVAIEAAASGLPIVATEIRRCGDVALVAAIERLVGVPEERAAMSAASAAKTSRGV
jgi:hypothetical protein